MKEYISITLFGFILVASGAITGYAVATRTYQHNDTYIDGFTDGLSVVIEFKEKEKQELCRNK